MADFIEIIKNIGKNFPERIAVIDRERKITYSEFLKLVNIVSNQLNELSKNPKVIIEMKQGIEAYALIIAVMNVCGTYCPINPEAPLERKKQIINEFNPNIIICDKIVADSNYEGFNLVSFDQFVTNNNTSEVVSLPTPEDTIYVIYTSGSTGQSKGVMISRKSLNKFLEWSIPTYAAGEGDIWGQFSLLSFDLSIVDIFTCLCSGATLFSMNVATTRIFRPSKIIELQKITIWHSVPSAVEAMMANEESKQYDFSSIRLMSFCGEPLKKQHVEFLFSKKNEMVIFNTYGPTEGTLFCTCQSINSQNYLEFCYFNMSIGKTIPGWEIYLKELKETNEKEIIIFGDYIGKGYLGKIQNSKFTEFVLSGKTVKAFETGDLVIQYKNNLYFSQRVDRQIKIKGYRIELNEIEYRINEYTKKNNVVVYKNNCLYSFIESNEEVDTIGLKQYLFNTLEDYKIPNDFYIIQSLPRSVNQKVDINALLQKIP